MADGRAVWRLAWPMIVSNVSVPLLGLVDAAILGHLPDARYLAAVAVGTTLFGFLYWGFGFLRMGTTGLVAQAWGRPADAARDSGLRLLLAQGIVLGGAIGVLVLVLSTPLLGLGFAALAPPPEVLAEAWRYCGIRVWSAPAVLATYALLGFLVGAQDTRSVLAVMVTTNLANIVLDLTLVLGFGMRTDGVAAATALSEYLGLALAAWLAWRRCASLGGGLLVAALLRIDAYRALLAVNGHLFVRTLCLLGTMAFFTAQGARQGEEILAANALLLNLLMLVSFGLDGFAHAAEALTGRAVGGGRPAEVARTVLAAGTFSLLTALAFSLLFAVGGGLLLDALTDLPTVAAAAHAYLPWLTVLPLLAVWCFLFDGVFIGATRTRAMRDTMIAATALVFLPIWALTRDLGNTGLWLAFDAFFVARGLGLGFLCWREARDGRWFVRAPRGMEAPDPDEDPGPHDGGGQSASLGGRG
ncbi:MAG TPA: MATE family efflux transporter [Pseudomonadales bacterium]|nr:MATE family efflux transporter [Pseudomonadales bacterium]